MTKTKARARATKAAEKRRGGRQKGPPSERMSLYLEEPIVQSVKMQAMAEGTTISDIVRQALQNADSDDRFTQDEILEAMKNSPLATMRFVTGEQYEHLEVMISMGVSLLYSVKAFSLPFIQAEPQFVAYYAEREREVVRSVALFYGHDEEAALKLVRGELERLAAEGRARGEQISKEREASLEARPVAVATVVDGEQPRRKFSLRALIGR